MGKLALAAKITHVPSMYLSELPGKNHGCRQGAIDGHKEISKRCREMGVDTIIVFDTHWLVNSAYHINCADHFEGIYTSNELPHFIRDMTYNYEGNPELGQLIADEALKLGVRARAIGIAVINATGNIGSALSPFMIGWLKDLTGSFNSGLWFVAALLVIGAGIIWAIPMQSSRPRATP